MLILGTPAEEGGGGKVRLIDAGAFEGVDAALMVHPAGGDLRCMNVIAVHRVYAVYHGQAAHAAAFPWKGRNALDAAVLGYTNVAALRQHIRPNERIHGVFRDGGDKPNIVPARAEIEWYVRAGNLAPAGAAQGPGAWPASRPAPWPPAAPSSSSWQDPVYADMRDNLAMVDLYAANAGQLGRTLVEPDDGFAVVGSTDMGNVSYVVPSIHPMIAVSPPHISIHTPEFADYARGPAGDAAVLDGAKAMAMTVADLWLRSGALDRVAADFGPFDRA